MHIVIYHRLGRVFNPLTRPIRRKHKRATNTPLLNYSFEYNRVGHNVYTKQPCVRPYLIIPPTTHVECTLVNITRIILRAKSTGTVRLAEKLEHSFRRIPIIRYRING